ncbi:peptidylprolyl isomerase [Deinococcus pimensis]|uniref:peptidylprolyl isomerase n=1 Tax=Deinococcus pimensis TaxID=309888 RepID=UPI0004823061|nr:peptidylprolyl isomerase [Deinococcus pimensis]
MLKPAFALAAALALGAAQAAWVPVPFLSETPVRKFDVPAWVIDPARSYRAVLTTTQGDVTVEFTPRAAPKAVNSFVFLALNHYYDGTPFHRVIDGFVAQGGDPTGTGTGGPGYDFFYEIDRTLKFDRAGVLGMARAQDPHSQGSQFFITLAPTDFLSGQYTVFGRVVTGQDVVAKLRRIDPGKPDATVKPDVLQKVTVLVDDGK